MAAAALLQAMGASAQASPESGLALALLARDEEQLLRRHLPLWRDLADCFVLGIDGRTRDGSEAAARELLAPKPLHAYAFAFDGFGAAKTELLRQAFEHCPAAEYLLLVEPDMMPVVESFDRSALSGGELVYAIRRSGKAGRGVRLADSVFRNNGRWRFDFRVHETPVYRTLPGEPGVGPVVKDAGWAVVELEGSVRDAQPRSARLREELRLVSLDLRERREHPRLTYYAGALRYELAMELRREPSGADGAAGEEIAELARQAAKLLRRRARDDGASVEGSRIASQEAEQQRSAAAYYCARTHADLLGDVMRAEKWYRRAMSLEPDFLHAHVALVQLLFKAARHREAVEVALSAEAAGNPRLRLFMDSAPLQVCDVPLLLSKALYYHYTESELRPGLVAGGGLWRRRSALLEAARRQCPEAAGESAERKLADIDSLQRFWEAEGLA